MALHDLTPQLRTRLSRLERLVGLFIIVATLLLLVGLGYYIFQMAQRKGWFDTKMPYFTFVQDASGLRVGDRVKLMGFDVGEIIAIEAQPPEDIYYNVFIRFRVHEPYFGYLWADSKARIGSSDFLGNRFIEVTKGSNGTPTYPMHLVLPVDVRTAMSLVGGTNNVVFGQHVRIGTNLLAKASEWLSMDVLQAMARAGSNEVLVINKSIPVERPDWIWQQSSGRYEPINTERKKKGYWLEMVESPALTERLETVVNTVEQALPGFLALTNRLASVLSNASDVVTHVDELLVSAKPIVTNAAGITASLNQGPGSLGEWVIPTNINQDLQQTLESANSTVVTVQTNVAALSAGVLASLENLANITSNLNAQVQANGFILSQLSELVVHTDEVIQGLKRHWLFKGPFQQQTNDPLRSVVEPRIGGKP